MYTKAKIKHTTILSNLETSLKGVYSWYETFPKAEKFVKEILKKEKFTFAELDSLEKSEQKDTLAIPF
jgi:hypothetical protein